MQNKIQTAVEEISAVLLGKEKQVQLALCCLFSGGHLLIEDLPGMGKTTLSQALAKVFGLGFNRIQFTSDLLPADILGTAIFDQQSASFSFHPGPIFTQLVLADEINRATPKTQSALLEAMEEGQVSIEGLTRPLPEPFFVIATQNPVTLAGTFPLPESQLDRFLMRLGIGYPDPRAERKLLENVNQREKLDGIQQRLSIGDIREFRAQVPEVTTSAALLDYVQRLIAHTRRHDDYFHGLSPRGGMAIVRAAKTWAVMNGRGHVLPEDVQAILPAVVEHRLRAGSELEGATGVALAQRLLEEVDVLNHQSHQGV